MLYVGRKINILGEEWSIKFKTSKEDEKLKDMIGYTDTTLRKIVICIDDFDEVEAVGDKDEVLRRVLRHEIIHALLFESGLSDQMYWATDESMVDFFALQFPKFNKIFSELNLI